MPTIVDFFGAHGQALSASPGAAYSWYSSGAATSITVGATAGRNSHPALVIQATAAGVNVVGFNVAAGNRKILAFGWFKVNQLPTLGTATIIQTTGPATNPGIQVTTGGVLRAFSGANTQAYSGTLTLGRWYFIQALIDCSGTVFTVDWKVYDETAGTNLAQTQCASASGQTAADIATIKYGNNASAAQWGDATHVGAWFSDIGYSLTAADFPMTVVETVQLLPTGIGTHSVGSGSFTKTGSVAVTGADTNSYLEIDEVPPSATDWVAQTAVDAAAYLEYTHSYAAAESRDPLAVKFYTDHQGNATGAYTMEVRARYNGVDSADITSGGTKSATTVVKRALCLALAPDGTAWTNAKAGSGTRIRFGYSGDATPDAQLNAVFSEALMPVSTGSLVTNTSTATAGSSVSVAKRPGRAVTPASAGTTLTTAQARNRVNAATATAGSTPTVVKAPSRKITPASAASAITVLAGRLRTALSSLTAGSTPTVGHQAQHPTTATAGSTPTVTKRPGRAITPAAAGSSSSVAKAPARTASVTNTATPTVTKRPALVRALTAAATATATGVRASLNLASVTAGNALSTRRDVARTTSATAGNALTITTIRQRVRAITATAASALSVIKRPAKTTSAAAGSSSTVAKRPSLTRSTTASSSTSATKTPGRTASTTAGSALSTRRDVARSTSAAASAALTAAASVGKAITVVGTSAPVAALQARITSLVAAAASLFVTATRRALKGKAGSTGRILASSTSVGTGEISATVANPTEGVTGAASDDDGRRTYEPADGTGRIEAS